MPRIAKPKLTTRISSVPEAKYRDSYISRSFAGVLDFDIFAYAMRTGKNVLIEGPTGPGKTHAVKAWAADNGYYLYRLPCNVGAEPSHFFGKYIPNEEPDAAHPYVWVDGPATEILREGGILFLDEVNFTPERVASVLFPLLDDDRTITLLDHKGEQIRAHRPDCWCSLDMAECMKRWVLVVAAMNPNYAGTRPLNAAFRNRFSVQLQWDYDAVVEEHLVPIHALRELVKARRTEPRQTTPVSTNMMMEFMHVYRELGYPFAVQNFVSHFSPAERPVIASAFDAAKDELEDQLAIHFGKAQVAVAPELPVPGSAVPGMTTGGITVDEAFDWLGDNW